MHRARGYGIGPTGTTGDDRCGHERDRRLARARTTEKCHAIECQRTGERRAAAKPGDGDERECGERDDCLLRSRGKTIFLLDASRTVAA